MSAHVGGTGAGFLAARYAAGSPLSLSASVVFEQSYHPVEGDSASAAELCALVSAVAEIPVRQSLAITGPLGQHGGIQAVGATNQKIEGFFDGRQARGLTGNQGVIIPATNVKHLMLRQDVIDAAAEDKFHVYPGGGQGPGREADLSPSAIRLGMRPNTRCAEA